MAIVDLQDFRINITFVIYLIIYSLNEPECDTLFWSFYLLCSFSIAFPERLLYHNRSIMPCKIVYLQVIQSLLPTPR